MISLLNLVMIWMAVQTDVDYGMDVDYINDENDKWITDDLGTVFMLCMWCVMCR